MFTSSKFKKNTIMKYFKMLPVLLLSAVLSFTGCNDKTSTPTKDAINATEVSKTPSKATTTTPPPTNLEPAQNTAGVWHYTCTKGCPGGAGSAVNCETCGIRLAHNQSYHTPVNMNTNTNPSAIPYANPPVAAEPSRNAAGVWHYVCSKGCEGGSGTTGACKTCGTALAHNTAYHQ